MPIIIVGLFLQRKSIGFLTSQCSKIYSSVARLKIISFESDLRMLIYPDSNDKKLGLLENSYPKPRERGFTLFIIDEKFLVWQTLFEFWIRFE